MAMITVGSAKRRVQAKTQEDVLPHGKERPQPPYFFSHYPNGWTFIEGHGFLPTLCKHPAIPGVNGAFLDQRTGRVNLARVEQGVRAKGGTVIRTDDERLLQAGETKEDSEFFDYCRYYDMHGGGRFYIEPGQVPTVTTRGEVIWNQKAAHAVNIRFRQHLVASGIISPIHYVEFARLEDAAETAVDHARQRASSPQGQADVNKRLAFLEAMRAEWARLTTDEAPAPTKAARKPRRRSTTDG